LRSILGLDLLDKKIFNLHLIKTEILTIFASLGRFGKVLRTVLGYEFLKGVFKKVKINKNLFGKKATFEKKKKKVLYVRSTNKNSLVKF